MYLTFYSYMFKVGASNL